MLQYVAIISVCQISPLVRPSRSRPLGSGQPLDRARTATVGPARGLPQKKEAPPSGAGLSLSQRPGYPDAPAATAAVLAVYQACFIKTAAGAFYARSSFWRSRSSSFAGRGVREQVGRWSESTRARKLAALLPKV
jgi:hypothetical protein